MIATWKRGWLIALATLLLAAPAAAEIVNAAVKLGLIQP